MAPLSPRPARDGRGRTAGHTLYLPTVAIAILAAWLGWRGWTALAQTGVARSFDAGRYQLAGPVVLAFVLVTFVVEPPQPQPPRPQGG